MLSPDARVAVRLELRSHRSACRARLARPLAEIPEQILDVVAVLVGEHVGLREGPAGRAELRAELVEEAEVDVDVLVDRAVERADIGARLTAAGAGRATEEHGLGRNVGSALGGELALPVRLHAVDIPDDPAVLLRVRVCAGLALLTENLRGGSL